MTTTGNAAPLPAAPAGRRWVTALIVTVLLMAVVLAASLLTHGTQANTDDLDPANPGYTGAQGLAQVLGQRGVRVTIVRSQGELLEEPIDRGTTVAITGTVRLSRQTARTALAHSAPASSLVLLDPDAAVTRAMSLPVNAHLAELKNVSAGCQSAQLGTGFRLAQANRAYMSTDKDNPATTCFPDKSDGGGAMVSLPAAEGRPPVTLLGDETLIRNGSILESDNAAIAIHLFGNADRLVWYVPTVTDTTSADSISRSIAPSWFQPGLALASSAVVLLCLWRGRRLGRLVTEPLPVIVRAIETTESRGRMYRKSRDRQRALAVLALATRRRLASYLGLSESSSVISVAAAAAAVSGRDYDEVLALLSSPAAQNDSSLLTIANTLRALEKEVRRP